MLQLSAKVIIFSEKTWKFTQINSCEIERDIENVLILPKATKWQGEAAIPIWVSPTPKA
jgi:hypothetical protein